MTNEEAKKWLNKLLARADITNEYGEKEDMQPYEEAVSIANEALEPGEELYRLITDSNSLMLLENYKTGERNVIEKRLKPCGDCISRAETQKHIYTRLYETALNNVGYKCEASDVFTNIAENRLSTWISEIPPIPSKPKAEWIPVSERLPEESLDSVIGWDAYRERPVFVEYYNGCFHGRGICLESFDIKAWMLLPEPYKAESKDT